MPTPAMPRRTAAAVTITALSSFWWAFACGGTLSHPQSGEVPAEETEAAADEAPSFAEPADQASSVRPQASVAELEAPRPAPVAAAPPSRPKPDSKAALEGLLNAPTMARQSAPVKERRARRAPVRKMKSRAARTGSAYGMGSAGIRGMSAGGGGKGRRHASGGALRMAPAPRMNTEDYAHIKDNAFRPVVDQPLSTFSVDVDTASYANMRRFIDQGVKPPADAVRIEELVNYFTYTYPQPRSDAPFSVYTEVATAPWNPDHTLLHVGLKGRSLRQGKVPARNLVYLIDVSGSMRSQDKLPLLKQGLSMLARQMRRKDRVAMVVYAGSSGVVLESTRGDRQGAILGALSRLQAGGSTHGSAGIQLAYRIAQDNFIEGGINRVVLATDGDFNVGVTSEGELTRLIERKRRTGVFLTVLGFGSGNLKDSRMEMLADKGNGNYAYIDSVAEARKVLVREAGSTLVTIAKDVKLQLEFNPARVKSYRLIGYENRVLAARDFNDDRKDAGEIGAGHTVTALYELVPADGSPRSGVDPLKYQAARPKGAVVASDELLTVKLRYKQPRGSRSKLMSTVVRDVGGGHERASEDFRWSAAVAGFGMVLRSSPHRGSASFELVHALAEGAIGSDLYGDRAQALQLMRRAERL